MTHLIVALAATALGVEAGWTPLPEGGHEYTIQIEPALLAQMRGGNDLVSEVPSHVDVRQFRITVGTRALARDDGPPPENLAQPYAAPAGDPAEPAVDPSVEPPAEAPFADNDPNVDPNATDPLGDPLAVPAMPADLFQPPNESAADTTASTADAPGDAVPANFYPEGADAQPLPSAEPPYDARAADADTPPEGAEDSTAAGAASDTTGQEHSAEKPSLAGNVLPAEKPWLPFAISAVLLACSLGANLYLGWIAWDWRGRYRDVLSKNRPATTA